MNRRRLLQGIMGALAYGSLSAPDDPLWAVRDVSAAGGTGKTLLVVFMRGGCDGLNTIVPYADPDYAALRPTIRIAPPGSGAGAALDLNGIFGLHPALAPLLPLYRAGEMAIFPAVHYELPSRSHFDSQKIIESGALAPLADGWLNRHMASAASMAPLRSLGLDDTMPQSLRGSYFAPSFQDLTRIVSATSVAESAELEAYLTDAYAVPSLVDTPNAAAVRTVGPALLSTIRLLRTIDASAYAQPPGAPYPASTFGTQIRQMAQVMKRGWGIEVATLSHGGWDVHIDQGSSTGTHATRLADLASGLAAFRADMGARMADVMVLVMTEFGRTAQENGSRGTDHGHASAWFVLGGAVRPGIYGAWPGLSPSALASGRFLAPSIDYRDIFAELLARHLGNAAGLPFALPGHSYRPIGFLA